MRKTALASALAASALFMAASANATPVIVNTALSNIASAFDSIITGTGSTVVTSQVVNGQSTYNYIDKDGNPATVTVTRPISGALASPSGNYSSNGISLSGNVWNISPSSAALGGTPPIPGFNNSGLTFTFSSPVNAFGFEIGDWATCCMTGTRPTAAPHGSTHARPRERPSISIQRPFLRSHFPRARGDAPGPAHG